MTCDAGVAGEGRHRFARWVFALVTSVFIASYTLADGLGARANGNAHGYVAWLFVLDGFLMLAILVTRRGTRGFAALVPYWRRGLAGGLMSLGAYWIAIWAMTVSPVAVVAALRESSVLFAAAISVFVLREPLTGWRTFAAIVIVTGISLARAG